MLLKTIETSLLVVFASASWWQSECATRHLVSQDSLSLSSSSFAHLFYLPLSLKTLCLWISVDRCVGDGCMPAFGPQVSELRTCVCVCDSYCCSGVWAWSLSATHAVNMFPPPKARRLLQAAKETTTNATSPQKGGGTRESGLWNGEIPLTEKTQTTCVKLNNKYLLVNLLLNVLYSCRSGQTLISASRLVPSAVLTHSRWAELGSCSWHVPARLNVTNTFLYLGMA